MVNYTRVIPRDLFNEAKLLKCLGQLVLKIGMDRFCSEHLVVSYIGEERGFVIGQDASDGALYCKNLNIWSRGRRIPFRSIYNSKSPYPFVAIDPINGETTVFSDDGEFTAEFLEFVAEWSNTARMKG